MVMALTGIITFYQCTRNEDTVVPGEAPAVRLKKGNVRFYSDKSRHPNVSVERIHALSGEQHPFAVIISCSDSRAPDEIVFDQGLGDLFVIRTAGNVIADIGLGSIEYAIEHLNVKYILVMGHEGCGAIKAFAGKQHPSDHIASILDSLAGEKEIRQLVPAMDANNTLSLVEANVRHQVRKIMQSSILANGNVTAKDIEVSGAVYDIHTGKVSFLD